MGNVSAISQLVQGENSLGIVPLDTDQTIEYYSALLRPQVDILVAVSHLGLDDDEDTATTNQGIQAQTASQVRGDVDVVFGGHLHIVLNPPKQIPIFINGKQTERQTVLVHSGAFAKTIGRLDLVVHVNTPDEIERAVPGEEGRGREERRAGAPGAPRLRQGVRLQADPRHVAPAGRRRILRGARRRRERPGVHAGPEERQQGLLPSADFRRHAWPCDWATRAPTSACSATGDQCLPCIYCHIPEDGKVLNIIEPYALAMNASSQFQLTRTFANNAPGARFCGKTLPVATRSSATSSPQRCGCRGRSRPTSR